MSATDDGERDRPRLVLITGLSGSGKSVAANALEDLGFFCVDNLPLTLLRTLLADPETHTAGHGKIAIGIDLRAPGFAEQIPELLEQLEGSKLDPVILYLEASEPTLLRRYSETRRSHPIGEGDRPVIGGIRKEKALLAPLRDAADLIFETSDWSVHDMRKAVMQQFGDDGSESGPLTVSLVSFGFKHGPPSGCDLVFDVRFLANPHFIPGLREQTGQDPEVQEFLDAEDDFHELLHHLESLLLFLLPRYRRENRRYLTVGVGCTGGRHRSVASSEALTQRLGEQGWRVRLSHRDIER